MINRIRFKVNYDLCYLRFTDELQEIQVAAVLAHLAKIMRDRPLRAIFLDLRSLQQLHPNTIQFFQLAFEKYHQGKIPLQILCTATELKKELHKKGMDNLFPFFENEKQALAALKLKEPIQLSALPEEEEMSAPLKRQLWVGDYLRFIFGLLGSFMLLLGMMTPVLSFPYLGNQNFFQVRPEIFLLLVFLGLSALLTVCLRRYGLLWIIGLGTILTLTYLFLDSLMLATQILRSTNELGPVEIAMELLGGNTDLPATVEYKWGWFLLILGSLILFALSTVKKTETAFQIKLPLALLSFLLMVTVIFVEMVTTGIFGALLPNAWLVEASSSGNAVMMRWLVAAGMDVNAKNKDKQTALFAAIDHSQNAVIQYLIEHGANLNVLNENGETPLLRAIRQDNFELVQILVDLNAVINQSDAQGIPPLHLSMQNKQSKIAHFLIDQGAMINAKDKTGQTPLIIAALQGDKEWTEYLLERGAVLPNNPKELDQVLVQLLDQQQFETAQVLFHNARENLLTSASLPRATLKVYRDGIIRLGKFLAEDKDLLNFQDQQGDTALSLAIKKQDLPSIKAILHTHADLIQSSPQLFQSAFEAARLTGNLEIIRLFTKTKK